VTAPVRAEEPTQLCECGGRIRGSGGIADYGGSHHGEVWGGNCEKCGRGFGDNADEDLSRRAGNIIQLASAVEVPA
jgi:hypothetical protein